MRNNLENAILEIEDGVEYLIDRNAANDIANNVPLITVKRLLDGYVSVVPIAVITASLAQRGIIDKLPPR